MSDVDVFLDIVDIDRGYCVRHGLLDRRYNRRLAGHILRNLNSLLAVLGPGATFMRTRPAEGWDAYAGSDGVRLAALLLPLPGGGASLLDRVLVPPGQSVAERARSIDLAPAKRASAASGTEQPPTASNLP